MATREKFAWLLLVMVAAALAAATLSPARVQTSAPATQISSNALDDHLTRIERRLERLESTRGVAGTSAAGETVMTAQAAAATPAGHPREDEPTSDASAPDAQVAIAQEQSRAAASSVVDRAIRAGIWTRKDADEWIVASAGLPAPERYALVRRLVVEVNNDRLKLDPGATFR